MYGRYNGQIPTIGKLFDDQACSLELRENPRRVQKILHTFFIQYFRSDEIDLIEKETQEEVAQIYQSLTDLFDQVDEIFVIEESEKKKNV